MPLISYNGLSPKVHDSVFVAPNAYITGDVTVGRDSSFFFGVVARGDILPIIVGERTNLQEHVLLHTSQGMQPCILGNDVTVGHGAIVHGATVKDGCLIGMGAIVLDSVEVGEQSLIGANALVPVGMKIPPRSMAFGSPAKVVRQLRDDEVIRILEGARHYVAVSRQYMAEIR